MLFNAIVNTLDLGAEKDWVTVRRELKDEQISKVYSLFEGLWPRETDLLQLLPKPDGNARAVYAGSIHPEAITDFALGASLYFGEILIEHPFLHAGILKKDYSPVQNPQAFRHEFLKSVMLFLTVFPLVDAGLVNLVPDPCNFDDHLREKMHQMATSRSAMNGLDPRMDKRIRWLAENDTKRMLMAWPDDVLRSQILRSSPEMGDTELKAALRSIRILKERDPLAVLQTEITRTDEKSGHFNMMKLSPNFEMGMYLAQATGSTIVTDSSYRWQEIQTAIGQRERPPEAALQSLSRKIENLMFSFPSIASDIQSLAAGEQFDDFQSIMREVFKSLSQRGGHSIKPNWEANLNARLGRVHSTSQAILTKKNILHNKARVLCAFPSKGIRDNTINRLLLMSSSEYHLPSVPMAFFIQSDPMRRILPGLS